MNHFNDDDKTLTPINQTVKIAILLRALRNAFGFSQTKLSALASCSRPTINRIESMDKGSPRSDVVDDLFNVFRERGVEIQVGNEEVVIRFRKDALHSAAQAITDGQVNVQLETTRRSSKKQEDSQPVDSVKKSEDPNWGAW